MVDESLTRSLQPFVGHLAQLGGTRHVILDEGRSRGVRAIEVNTGAGLCFTILPDRGLDISRCTFKGTNLVYLGPCGETHPAYYDARGLEWLRGFFGGLLTTCGPTYLGPPCEDEGESLGLHGRHTHTPAHRVADLSGWDFNGEYVIHIRGELEESILFSHKLKHLRNITGKLGENKILLEDTFVNEGDQPCPLTVLYHVNLGYPFLHETGRLEIEAGHCEPCDEESEKRQADRFKVTPPQEGFAEQNFLYSWDRDEEVRISYTHPTLEGGLRFTEKFSSNQLPYLNQWKMLGHRDYVMGLEPCNVPCLSRAALREKGLFPLLSPGETRRFSVEIGVEPVY